MLNIFFRLIGCAFIVLLVSACGSVKTKTYIVDKERVDQNLQGNAGYLQGSQGKQEADIERKKTRKMFVFEFTKDPEEVISHEESLELETVVQESSISKLSLPPRDTSLPDFRQTVDLPLIEGDDFYLEEVLDPKVEKNKKVEYIVQRNDTLQKISKKFYGNYSQWMRIYEANKSDLKDPNFLKPGMVITVPLDE